MCISCKGSASAGTRVICWTSGDFQRGRECFLLLLCFHPPWFYARAYEVVSTLAFCLANKCMGCSSSLLMQCFSFHQFWRSLKGVVKGYRCSSIFLVTDCRASFAATKVLQPVMNPCKRPSPQVQSRGISVRSAIKLSTSTLFTYYSFNMILTLATSLAAST